MTHLEQLNNPGSYRPCDWDLQADAAGRAHWLTVFRWHVDAVLLPLIESTLDGATPEKLAAFRADYLASFEHIEARPESFDRLDVLRLTEERRRIMTRHGFEDPFIDIKQHESEVALALLPKVLAEADAAEPDQRLELLARGLLAGNIFDLGSRATVERHRAGDTAFVDTCARLPSRPWLVDDLASWRDCMDGGAGYRHAVIFVDNAGGDIVLGVLPMARLLLQGGARVTLAANTGAALNDITAAELVPLLARCADQDQVLGDALEEGRLCAAANGCEAPLVDLTELADDFVAAVAGADLIWLHGMGRAIESNFHASFTCDALWTAVLKDETVAARAGGGLFDCVFRWRAGGAPEQP